MSNQIPRDRPIEILSTAGLSLVYLPKRNALTTLGGDVERIDQFSFYGIGKSFSKAIEISGAPARLDVIWVLFDIGHILKKWLSGTPMPLGISRGRAQSLKDVIDSIMTEYFQNKAADGKMTLRFPEKDDGPIAQWDWDRLKTAIANFETVLSDEMREAATYYVPRRGIFFTPALVDSADEGFPEDIQQFIPPKTREDWKSAGRCLAFNLLSASGFHVARAVEGILESYYQMFCNKPGKTLRSWHDYLQALDLVCSGGASPCPTAKTLAEIRQMKDDYRNPIVHPRVVLSESDARMLFANGESLIIAMAQELKSTTSAGVQPGLALAPASTISSP